VLEADKIVVLCWKELDNQNWLISSRISFWNLNKFCFFLGSNKSRLFVQFLTANIFFVFLASMLQNFFVSVNYAVSLVTTSISSLVYISVRGQDSTL
jgi:hypothetical protein